MFSYFGSPTPAVEDLLDDTPEVSEVSHILIIYKLLLINVLKKSHSAMDLGFRVTFINIQTLY